MIVPGQLDRVAVRAPHRADACSARRRREIKGRAPKAVGYGRAGGAWRTTWIGIDGCMVREPGSVVVDWS